MTTNRKNVLLYFIFIFLGVGGIESQNSAEFKKYFFSKIDTAKFLIKLYNVNSSENLLDTMLISSAKKSYEYLNNASGIYPKYQNNFGIYINESEFSQVKKLWLKWYANCKDCSIINVDSSASTKRPLKVVIIKKK